MFPVEPKETDLSGLEEPFIPLTNERVAGIGLDLVGEYQIYDAHEQLVGSGNGRLRHELLTILADRNVRMPAKRARFFRVIYAIQDPQN